MPPLLQVIERLAVCEAGEPPSPVPLRGVPLSRGLGECSGARRGEAVSRVSRGSK